MHLYIKVLNISDTHTRKPGHQVINIESQMVPYSCLVKIAHNPTSKRYIFFTSFIVRESYEFMAYQNHLADLLNYKSLGPPLRVSDSCRSVWGLIICISNKSSGDANAAGLVTRLWKALLWFYYLFWFNGVRHSLAVNSFYSLTKITTVIWVYVWLCRI